MKLVLSLVFMVSTVFFMAGTSHACDEITSEEYFLANRIVQGSRVGAEATRPSAECKEWAETVKKQAALADDFCTQGWRPSCYTCHTSNSKAAAKNLDESCSSE